MNTGRPHSDIPAEEPVFILRAQDRFAASAVRFWAFSMVNHGGDQATFEAAMAQAAALEAWPVKKMPDIPKEPANALG